MPITFSPLRREGIAPRRMYARPQHGALAAWQNSGLTVVLVFAPEGAWRVLKHPSTLHCGAMLKRAFKAAILGLEPKHFVHILAIICKLLRENDMIGWFRKILGGAQTKTVGDVISAYTSLLEGHALTIFDVSMLPMPKAKMKVLFKGLYAKASRLEQKSFYETGFILLSQFQDGVGTMPINGKILEGDLIADLEANSAILDKWLPWHKLSTAEGEILAAEWKRFLEGEPI